MRQIKKISRRTSGIPSDNRARDSKRARDMLMLAVGIAAIAPFGALSAQAAIATHTWVGTPGNWTSNGNPGWNGTGVPVVAAGDIAVYSTATTTAVTTLDSTSTVT